MNETRERLAAYAHDAWSGWMKYMFGKGAENADGSFTIAADSVARWSRQMNTPYADLPEEEKASDRKEADQMLAIIHDPKEVYQVRVQLDQSLYVGGTIEEIVKEAFQAGYVRGQSDAAHTADEVAAAHRKIGIQGRFTADYRAGAADAASHVAHLLRKAAPDAAEE